MSSTSQRNSRSSRPRYPCSDVPLHALQVRDMAPILRMALASILVKLLDVDSGFGCGRDSPHPGFARAPVF